MVWGLELMESEHTPALRQHWLLSQGQALYPVDFVTELGRDAVSFGFRLVFYGQATSAITAPRTPRRTCCPHAYVRKLPDGFNLHLLQG